MIRIVTTRRLRENDGRLTGARFRARKAENLAEEITARADTDLAAAFERAEAAERRAATAVREAASVRAALEGTRVEATRLREELAAVLRGPVVVIVLLHRGRLHSVHAREEDALRTAESDPVAPADPGGWTGWKPLSENPVENGWCLRRITVQRPDPGVHDTPSGVHGPTAGVHGDPVGSGRDG
ncbi:hypothetical protein [Streptomyces sp. ST2-7A]|uniref:hypothetical protein n=1 Tax=Streptomyces sp. ST2-7A TaxID=2907214 RepID=UPI001F311F51|nr:hypothetical protein [Streptomyces sp. ST2-7A]MCE7078843.1 hypothetical protein [Streptomyces sp. ST2-7A]